MKRLGLSLFLLVMAGCIAETPQEPPRRGLYNNEPVTFSAPYDDVWLATATAVEELNWDTKNADKGMGIIELRTSYVYTRPLENMKEYTWRLKTANLNAQKLNPT